MPMVVLMMCVVSFECVKVYLVQGIYTLRCVSIRGFS